MSEGTIRRASLSDIRKMKDDGKLLSADQPGLIEELGPDFWADAKVLEPRQPRSVHLKLDPEVFDYFKSLGKGHLTRMQNVLKAYAEHHAKGQQGR